MDGMAVESAFALLLTKVTKEGLVPDLVPGIGQILYHVFKLIADAFNLVVGLVFEEHIDEVWKFLQLRCPSFIFMYFVDKEMLAAKLIDLHCSFKECMIGEIDGFGTHI